MKTEKYEGPITAMRTSPWLASEDLLDRPGKSAHVVIECVHKHEGAKMQDGRTEKVIYTLKFKDRAKEMVINATNRKTLLAVFGPIKEWEGKEVEVYVDSNVKQVGGGRGNGLRIRTKPQAVGGVKLK